MYLSSLQVGLQSAHVLSEMFLKFPDSDDLRTWASEHKTMILLNGGYSSTLHEIYDALEDTDNPYPFAKFHESEDALDGALTCVGIILPEEIYEVSKEIRAQDERMIVSRFNMHGEWTAKFDGNDHNFTKWQVWLINELNKYGLAR